MAVSLEKFIKQLEESGVLSGETLSEFLPPKKTPKDAEDLARELVRQKKLTKFQVEEVSRGKGKSLTLGKYLLLEKIGAGGMGQVFKARHQRMDRLVAIKLLPSATMKEPVAIARFEREVVAAARLRHPNIVAADDADQANGIYFLVMELIEGRDLSAIVKQDGPLPVDTAVNYILQAARGLDAAHAEGIVHRDIKPANLLLDKRGIVKILDMGLARLSGTSDGGQRADLTSTGTIMGTVDYMAPEQALDTKSADARADIYALGCSLFYLLTGKAIYDGDTLMKKLLAHREQPVPSLCVVRPEVPAHLDAIFQRMIAKKTEHRYQSIRQVIDALDELHGMPQQAEPHAAPQAPISDAVDLGLTDLLTSPPIATSLRPERAKKERSSVSMRVAGRRFLPLIGGGLLGMAVLIGLLVNAFGSGDAKVLLTVNEPGAVVQLLGTDGMVQSEHLVDGESLTMSVKPGVAKLLVSKAGFEPFRSEFSLVAGKPTPVAATLVPLAGRPVTLSKRSMPDSPSADESARPVRLFNGKNLDDWTIFGDRKNFEVDPANAAIVTTGASNCWMLTNSSFGDFALSIQYQTSTQGNSGIGVLALPEDEAPIEIQLGHESNCDTGALWLPATSSTSIQLLSAQHSVEERSSPAWNRLVIFLEARKLTTYVNGTEVSSFDLTSLYESNKSITALQRTSGRIGLQSNADSVRFRDLQILELQASGTSESTLTSPAFQQWLMDALKPVDDQ